MAVPAGRTADAFAYCAAFVRERDPERATAALFATAERQPYLMALAAFDIETASIADHVSQSLPGEIRLQWWRDLLEAGGGSGGSPIADAILVTVEDGELPIALLDRMLDARIFDLYDDPMPELVDLETYAGETAATILSLGARLLATETKSPVGDIAGHGGVALTIEAILHLARRDVGRAQKFVPDALFRSTGTERGAWAIAPAEHPSVGDALVALAHEHLAKALAGFVTLDRSVRPAFLPLTTLERRLDSEHRALSGEPYPTKAGPLRRSYDFWRAMRRVR